MMRYARAAIAAAYLSVVAAPIVPVMFLALAVAPIADVAIVHAVAFAADSAPETVAQATSEANKVVWAWGATVSEIASAVAWVLVSLAMVMLRKLPANLVAIFGNARVELLIDNAINYGLNAVAGAVKDKKLEVDVGNQVLREALQYAIDNAPGWLQSWAGGPEQIAKKIWAKLNLGDGADAAVLPAVVDSVKPS
ncbi:hypothetical protein [Azospirillum sp.]|uniref:hypothetical protein n=1 Tax=Azospirillum sp. TaxID=34012 RepID=UPI002D2F2EA4|nr:hypothetical protein [Azospirillum sp.]HYD66158.1 hypothetical protein [Azospirillum sp.]